MEAQLVVADGLAGLRHRGGLQLPAQSLDRLGRATLCRRQQAMDGLVLDKRNRVLELMLGESFPNAVVATAGSELVAFGRSVYPFSGDDVVKGLVGG